MSEEDMRQRIREDFPTIDIEPLIKVRNGLIVNDFVSRLHCIPWTVGRTTLMGDSSHTQGPEAAVGLNLNYDISRSFINLLK